MSEDKRSVLIAQLLAEADGIFLRAEKIEPAMRNSAAALVAASQAMTAGVEKTRAETAAIIEHAQAGAVKFIVRRANEVTDEKLIEQTAALEKAARSAIDAAMEPRMSLLLSNLNQAVAMTHHKLWRTWLTHLATALIAGTLGAVIVFVFFK